MRGRKKKNKPENKVKRYTVTNTIEIKNSSGNIDNDIDVNELKADQILIKVDIKTGKIIVDNLEKFWHNFGVISIPNTYSKVIELSSYKSYDYKNNGGDE
jgi:hypothetical protein